MRRLITLQHMAVYIYVPLDSYHTCELSSNCIIRVLQLHSYSVHSTEYIMVEAGFDSQPTAETFLFTTEYRPALGSIQPSTRLTSGSLSPG
jgi:hypothetical protein